MLRTPRILLTRTLKLDMDETMVSYDHLLSHTVANIYLETKSLDLFFWNYPSHWFRFVDNTWVKTKIKEVEAVTDHLK